jgi:hypothetical protein
VHDHWGVHHALKAVLLPFAQRIVNASFHSAIGASPAQLIFGGNLDLDRCILARPSIRAATAVPSYVDELSDAQFILFESIHLQSYAAKNLSVFG